MRKKKEESMRATNPNVMGLRATVDHHGHQKRASDLITDGCEPLLRSRIYRIPW